MKKTLILGATDNPHRFAYKAAHSLLRHGHPIALVGIKKGSVAGQPILNGKPQIGDVDTVTLYVGPHNQQEWYDYIINLKPKRIIFNPGTENAELEDRARENGIHIIEGCTLVMLSAGLY